MLRCCILFNLNYVNLYNKFNLLLILLATLKYTSVRVTHTHLILPFWITVKKAQFQSEEVIFERGNSTHVWPKIINHANEQKSSIHLEWEMTSRTHFRLNCMNELTKSRFEVDVTSCCRNKTDRRVKKHLTTPVFEPMTSRSITISTVHSAISLFLLLYCNRFYTTSFTSEWEQ